MSTRGSKRALSRGEEGGCKRRRTDTDESSWQPRPLSDLKISTIYNRSATEAPAELFRKDLISAMKLPDSEPLASGHYWVITDSWRQEWERGVQVPVNPDSLPEPAVTVIKQASAYSRNDFKLPKQKYVRSSKDANFSESEHHLSNPSNKNEAAYDLDACDLAWLRALNGERARAGVHPIREEQLERVIEELEVRCWDKIQAILKSEEGLGIEYDENVICDVCRSPDSEEGNEMVFCDSCNICVHQACYGITAIPSGQWLCRPCTDGVRPTCVLCPNLGGAMKCTPAGHKWAHVSCVLWIPEVSIGCAEKMEPITKISAIPPSRWSLVCVLCRERKGACIQCSVRTCKIAYHVTCAFKHALEMRAIIEDENADDGVKLRSYCQKHSVNCKKDKSSAGSGSEEDDSKRKRRKDMTSEEKSQARALRLHEIEAEFDKHVSIKDISTHLLDVDQDGIQYIYNYWKLKRKSGHNRPLLPPKTDDNDILTDGQGQADLDKMKMFVQLRQDLERVRNLCYMVSRREKFSRSFFRMREQTFHKQVAVLSGETLSPAVMTAVLEANHGPSIYDILYSRPNAVDHTLDFENLLNQIAGVESGDEKKKDLNGLVKGSKSLENPYKRLYINGSARRSASLYSGISSGAESIPDRDSKYRRSAYFTTDEEDKPTTQSPKKKLYSKDSSTNKLSEKKKPRRLSRNKLDSSSEDDVNKFNKRHWPKSKTLRKMELEMANRPFSGSESDDLIPISSTKKLKLTTDIYSDSENSDNKIEDVNEDKSSNGTSDSQQHMIRTKAAVKEFVPLQKDKNSRRSKLSTPILKSHESDDDVKDKENIKSSKNKDNPSDLIVPQREAAKKASENLRTNTSKREQSDTNETKTVQSNSEEPKSKGKPKVKDKKDPKEQLKEANKKDRKLSGSGNDTFEFDKEVVEKDPNDILAYVPQRKAAKKAAEHIKSGMTKTPGTETSIEDPSKKKEVIDVRKSPKKEEEKKQKSPSKSSRDSALSSTSSSSSSSSSSEAEEESAKTNRFVEKRSMVKSLFSPPRRRNDDLPFLDKGSKVTYSSSPSSESESKREDESKNSSMGTSVEKKQGLSQRGSNKTTPRKASEKKPKITNEQPKRGLPEGEKSSRTSQPISRASTRARTRSSTSGSRDLFDTTGTRKQKQNVSEENNQPSKLPSTEWKTDKKVKPISKSADVEQNCNELPAKKEKEDNESVHTQSPKIKTDSNLSRSPKRISSVNSKDKENFLSQKSVSPFPSSPNVFKADGKSPEVYMPRHLSSNNEQLKLENTDDHTHCESESVVDKDIISSPEKNIYKSPSKLFSAKHVVKSPKTVENKISEPCEGQTLKMHSDISDSNTRITNLSADEKVAAFEIAPSEFNDIHDIDQRPFNKAPPYNHSIFSPQNVGKDSGCELFELFSDDTFININIPPPNEEIIMKAPSLNLFGPELLFKEDSKEDSARETLNLVEKLRMQMSSKKPSIENQEDVKTVDLLEDKDQRSLSIIGEVDDSFKSNNNNDEQQDLVPKKLETDDRDASDKFSSSNVMEDKSHIEELGTIDDKQSDFPTTETPVQQKSWEETSSNFKDLSKVNDSNKHSQFIMDQSQPQEDNIHTVDKDEPAQNKFLEGDEDKHFENQVDSNASTNNDHLQISVCPTSDINLITESHRTNFDSNLLIQPPECTPIPSPFNSMRRQPKWAESELIPARRSSTSSSASDMSMGSIKKDDNDHHSATNENISEQDNPEITHNMSYNYSCSMDSSSYNTFSSEASQFVSGSLFPATTISSQASISRSTALFPPNVTLPYPNTSSLMPHVPKSNEESVSFNTHCCAAFTSSSHNMAITTAMVAPPTPKGSSEHSPAHEPVTELSIDNSYKSQSPVSIQEFGPNTDLSNEIVDKDATPVDETPSQGKKSPSKPTRTSSRFVSQQGKSPGISPGKSPRQSDSNTKTANKRGGGKGCRGLKSRGRPRGRGCPMSNAELAFFENTIHNKLVGTVYDLDFDEEIANDFKPIRERRKSGDVHDRKGEIFRESSHSPSFTSPSQHTQSTKKSTYSADVRDIRPLTPITELPPIETDKSPPRFPTSVRSAQPSFPSIVQPVFPGPVDMRTYSAFEPSTDVFNNHLLGAFASGTADQQLHEIDEEMEKEFHSQLMASRSQDALSLQENANDSVEKSTEEVIQSSEIIPKVSLSDSRNQLKVKIKGPFLDANYSSSITPANQQVNAPIIEQSNSIQMYGAPSAVSSVASAIITGTSNLRRMRKKELLRQYCTQDMNMDDPAAMSVINQVSQPNPIATFNRTVIKIPKAVASMTSFPTKDDYKDVVDANSEKKRRKISNNIGRDVCYENDIDMSDKRNSTGSSMLRHLEMSYKRKGRISKPNIASINNIAPAPKLKIKIGNYPSGSSSNFGPETDAQFKPPKKRLASIPKPSVDDLRRESMKYRKMVFADFEEGKKEKKKRIKTEKRKKKREKRGLEMHFVNKKTESATKLIIRIARKKENSNKIESEDESLKSVVEKPVIPVDPYDYDPSAPDPLAIDSPLSNCLGDSKAGSSSSKVTPIRLKLSRGAGGSGYIMKDPPSPDSDEPIACSIPSNKHCQVR